jgi:hypothetical protein
VPTPTEPPSIAKLARESLCSRRRTSLLASLLIMVTGCGEPSVRELENRRELEALLTAVSLKNKKELDRDMQRIDDRHASGVLSDDSYKDLEEIVKKARAGDWGRAERQAYELRESKPFFK